MDWLIAIVAVAALIVLLFGISVILSLAATATLGVATGSIIRLSILPAIWYLAKPTVIFAQKMVYGLIDAERSSVSRTGPSPQQKFAADMRATLVSAAKEILSNDSHPLDRLLTFAAHFGSIIASIRKVYGPGIVDEHSPAMEMVKAFAEGGEAQRAVLNKFDWFMSKLREAKGNDEATLALMAYMLNAHRWQQIIDGRIIDASRMKGSAEIDQLRRLRQAIATISSKLLPEKEPWVIATTAAAALAMALTNATNSAIRDIDNRFAAGVFAVVFTSYFAPLLEGDFNLAAAAALFEVSSQFWDLQENAAASGQWASGILQAYNDMVQSKAKAIYEIGESCEAWFKNPDPLQFNRLAELFRSFRECLAHLHHSQASTL